MFVSAEKIVSLSFYNLLVCYYPVRMRIRGRVIGLSVSLSVHPSGLSSEGLVEGLFQDRSVRIQTILASTDQRSTGEAEKVV